MVIGFGMMAALIDCGVSLDELTEIADEAP